VKKTHQYLLGGLVIGFVLARGMLKGIGSKVGL
jgi:hypothetical protein